MIDHMTFSSDASGACTIKAGQREFESTAETKGDRVTLKMGSFIILLCSVYMTAA